MVYVKEIRRLAGQGLPSPFPFLSVYLDTSQDGKGRRTCVPFIRKHLTALRKKYRGRSEAVKSLLQDVDGFERHLKSGLVSTTRGLAVFACAGKGIFDAFSLPVSPKNLLAVGPGPALSPWALLKDEYDTNLLLVADTRRARLFVIRLGSLVETKELATVVEPLGRRFERLGLAKPRMERRMAGKLESYTKRIVQEVALLVRKHDVRRVAMAGDNVILPELSKALSSDLSQKICTRLALDIRVPSHEALKTGIEVFRQAEEKEAEDKARKLAEELPSGRCVAGTSGTLGALESGKAIELLLGYDYHEPGSWCSACGKSTRGPAKPCSCGGETIAEDLRERCVALAVARGVGVEFVRRSPEMSQLGEIGAFLTKR